MRFNLGTFPLCVALISASLLSCATNNDAPSVAVAEKIAPGTYENGLYKADSLSDKVQFQFDGDSLFHSMTWLRDSNPIDPWCLYVEVKGDYGISHDTLYYLDRNYRISDDGCITDSTAWTEYPDKAFGFVFRGADTAGFEKQIPSDTASPASWELWRRIAP